MYFVLVLALAAGSVQGIATTDRFPLPGCTVTLSSPAGMISAVTDVEGRYRFDSVEPGSYELLFELDGLESVQRRIEVGEGANEQEPAELPVVVTEQIAFMCSIPTCQDDTPASVWELPACSDHELDSALIESMERGDRSALELLRSRYPRAQTYAEKHTIARSLLRRVPDDRVYWNELFEHARNAVRFKTGDPDHSGEFVQWCRERGYEPDAYDSMAYGAFTIVAEDPRSRALLREALAVPDDSLLAAAITGFAVQRDSSALPLIDRAVQRYRESGGESTWIVWGLIAYGTAEADQLAFRYLDDDGREEYLDVRNLPQEE
jgi:hypothetical protein